MKIIIEIGTAMTPHGEAIEIDYHSEGISTCTPLERAYAFALHKAIGDAARAAGEQLGAKGIIVGTGKPENS